MKPILRPSSSILLTSVFCLALCHSSSAGRGADGEGFPQANAASSSLAPAELPKNKADFHIYILMGQSNMAGRGSLQPASQADNPRLLSLDAQGGWVIARDPLHVRIGRIEPGVGPGLSFAHAMLETETNPPVAIGLIPCAVGGSPLHRWAKGKRGDLYAQMLERVKVAAKAGTIKGVLWHQGEADAVKRDTAESYESRLSRMIADLRADLGQPDLPVVVGQLGEFLRPEKQPYAGAVRAALTNTAAKVPRVGCADSVGLKDKGDNLHFNADAAREFGARYAAAMKKLQKQ